MQRQQVTLEMALALKDIGADVTLKSLHVHVVNVSHVLFQVLLTRTNLRAKLA